MLTLKSAYKQEGLFFGRQVRNLDIAKNGTRPPNISSNKGGRNSGKTTNMKKLQLLFLFFIISVYSIGQTTANKKIIVQTLDFDYLEGCETGKGNCKPIEILRQTKQDSILLVFPNGGTFSDVYLRSKDLTIELHDKKTAGQGKPQLNMTGLADGEYSANIISCGLGGACLIRLKTKLP